MGHLRATVESCFVQQYRRDDSMIILPVLSGVKTDVAFCSVESMHAAADTRSDLSSFCSAVGTEGQRALTIALGHGTPLVEFDIEITLQITTNLLSSFPADR